jgi:transcriptional regulator with PAS, ATPase and Fis domain
MAAIPDTLIEAELFGVTPGAYTGADRRDRQGKLQIAQGGTLFLDEIGDMPLPVQSKLLRVLQEKEFEPLGSNEVLRSDVRIIAATSRTLLELVKEGRFRADLYYRLDVLSLAVPPLRERIEDLELICEALLEGFAESRPGQACELHADALALLARQRWPGNIRELRNVLERTIVLSDSPVLTVAGVQVALQSSRAASSSFRRYAHADVRQVAERDEATTPSFSREAHAQAMNHYERQLIERALAESPTVAAAAKRLGMGRATLYRKMAAHRIGSFRSGDISPEVLHR